MCVKRLFGCWSTSSVSRKLSCLSVYDQFTVCMFTHKLIKLSQMTVEDIVKKQRVISRLWLNIGFLTSIYKSANASYINLSHCVFNNFINKISYIEICVCARKIWYQQTCCCKSCSLQLIFLKVIWIRLVGWQVFK